MKYQLNAQALVLAALLGVITFFLSKDLTIAFTVFGILLVPAIIELYVPYANDNLKNLWFKRKIYGWGWTPVTWQGWLITILYVVFVTAFALTIDENSPTREIIFTFVLPTVLLTLAFIGIAHKKGEKPRWQWGIKNK